MATNKRKISDQVLYIIYGGDYDGSPVQEQDIVAALEQKINQKFRIRHFETMKLGETIPDGLCFATYNDIAVTSYQGRSRSALPVIPISLPRNVGVYDIRYDDTSFIPLQIGQRNLLKTDTLLNNLLNQVGYEVKGGYVYYTSDLTLIEWDTVDMDLVVSDLSTLSETDDLPIPADYEIELVAELVEMFSPVPPKELEINPHKTTNLQRK